MPESKFVTLVSAISIYMIELLKGFLKYAPEITFIVQLIIGVLTIVYLVKKIKYFKK